MLKFVFSFTSLFTKTEIVIIVNNVLPQERFRFDACMMHSALKMGNRLIVTVTMTKKLINIMHINNKAVAAFMAILISHSHLTIYRH